MQEHYKIKDFIKFSFLKNFAVAIEMPPFTSVCLFAFHFQ